MLNHHVCDVSIAFPVGKWDFPVVPSNAPISPAITWQRGSESSDLGSAMVQALCVGVCVWGEGAVWQRQGVTPHFPSRLRDAPPNLSGVWWLLERTYHQQAF